MLLDHLLVVTVTLLRTASLHLSTHHHIDPEVLLDVDGEVEESGMREQELKVTPVLLGPPVETYVFLSTSTTTATTAQLPHVLQRHLIIFVFFTHSLLDLSPSLRFFLRAGWTSDRLGLMLVDLWGVW